MVENRCEIRVRYAETDAMGIAYHTNYIIWFEVGRTELIRSLGYPYARLEEEGIIMPLTEVQAKYKAPAKYDDVLVITARVDFIKGASIKIDYEIRHQKTNQLLVQGYTKHGFTDRNLKPIRIKETEFYKVLVK